MRTALAALAALAAVTSSMAAVPAFDKADCGSMTSNAHTATLAGVANGEWSCVTFSVGLDSQQLVKLDMESRWLGYTLQVMLWNNGQVAGDTAANTWRDSSAGRGVLDWIKAQNGQNDINGLPAAHNARYSNISAGVGLTVINGWSGDVVNYRDDGVYAMRGSVKPAPGRNTFIISNPDAATPGGTFGGSFMYRLVNMNTADNLYSLTGLTATQVNAHWGQLATGSPVTIPNVLLPGTGFTVPISDTWAKVGFGLKGLKYTVSIAPGGSTADVAQDRMGWADPLPFPNGYSTTAGMEKSFTDVSPGSLIKNQPWAQTRLSSTNVPLTGTEELWYDYSSGAAAWGPWNGTQTYGSNSISIDWRYPVDVTSNPGGTFAYLSINTPVVQNDVDATVRPYDWTGQSSPFWDVTVTIDRVDEYPLLGSESNVELSNKNNKPVDGHNAASTATDPATGPYKIYRVGTSNPLWWRMIVNMNNVVDKNLPAGTTEEGPACPPHWDYQIVQDANNGHSQNGWGEEWFNLRKDAGGYGAEDFWASNLDAKNDDIDTANGWLTNDEWRDSSQRLVSSARNTLLPKFDVGRNTWLLVRVSATSGFVDNGVKSCGSNHVTIGSLSASWDTVDDQCADYTDCLVATADNPNADQDGDSANRNARRFSNCYLYQKPGSNYRWVPTTKCVECFEDWQCGEGQYCHLDEATATISWGSYNGVYSADPDSAKLFGTCQQKSTDVLGKRCRTLTGGSSGSRMGSYFPVAGSGSAVTVQNGAGVRNAAASPTDLLVATKGDADNADFAEGAYGACGEFRYVHGRDPNTGSLVDNNPDFISAGSGSSLVRIALWTGFCDSDQICRECVPGSTGTTSGKVCLNGRSFSAMDVDDTVRSFGQNTVASTELGTTAMIILLIILFCAYMYTEATRWRHANGLPPMTCCECLCCCGCCSKLGAATATATKNPAVAA